MPYLVHKYFKKNKDQHEKNYYHKITEENKWLKKLSPIKRIKQHKKKQIITVKTFCRWKSLY